MNFSITNRKNNDPDPIPRNSSRKLGAKLKKSYDSHTIASYEGYQSTPINNGIMPLSTPWSARIETCISCRCDVRAVGAITLPRRKKREC